MKKTILLSLLALLLPLCFPKTPSSAQEPAAGSAEPLPPFVALTAAETPSPVESAAPADAALFDAELPETVLLQTGDGVIPLAMRDYLCGVVAAEMPASFPEEALKAQAVAARTFAVSGALSGKHGEAAVCGDSACCQAWLGEEALRARWGDDYERWAEKIRRAVDATEGQILCYERQPVFAAFHSSSAGATESCGAVWNERPYLVSVPSPETAADVPDFVSTASFWPTDFRDTLLSVRPDADFSGPENGWIGEISRDESGRVSEAVLGGVPLRGTELRRLFSLRSTAFELRYTGGLFVFTVTGSGHGVGMSQYGAKVMAERGADYRTILAHYYPGTELTQGKQKEPGE